MTGPIKSNGVTLIEFIAALVVFSLLALGLIALTPAIQQMGQHSDQPEQWLHQARSCAEELVSLAAVDEGNCDYDSLSDDLVYCDPDSSVFNSNNNYCQIEIIGDQDYETIVIRLPRN